MAGAFFFLESCWALLDASLLSEDYLAMPVILNSARMVTIGVLFGINARLTIFASIVFAAMVHIEIYWVISPTSSDDKNFLGLFSTITLVFAAVTAFWCSLNERIKLKVKIQTFAHERKTILENSTD